MAATIHRNLREQNITIHQSKIIFDQFDLDESNHIWTLLPISPELLSAVMEKFRLMKPSTYLRAADALHLTCAVEHGFKEIYSNDRHLLTAAATFKIKGINILR